MAARLPKGKVGIMHKIEQSQSDSNSQHPARTPRACALRIYPRGAVTDRGARPQTSRNGQGGKRGAVTSFSRAAAARLRRLLATTCGPDGWTCFGATFTIPGPQIEVSEWLRVWNAFRHRIFRLRDILVVWRIELQQRGQPHVHAICWGKDPALMHYGLKEAWLDSLTLLGPVEGPCELTPSKKGVVTLGRNDSRYGRATYTETGKTETGIAVTVKADHRALWPAAEFHAVKTSGLEECANNGWWRYLAAHTSKSKQAQLGWQGRQYGVLNRRLLVHATAEQVKLSDRACSRVIRCLRRLTRCRFASGHGTQTWFVMPDTMRRLSGWALSLEGWVPAQAQ